MFSGVARYVCRPQVTVHLASAAVQVSAPTTAATVVPRALPRDLSTVCGNDLKLRTMVERHLAASPCALSGASGIDLDTMLRRDHRMPLNDFVLLSTVNRKILLLDTLKRHGADVWGPEDEGSLQKCAAGPLSPQRRHDLLVEQGRKLLLQLHKK